MVAITINAYSNDDRVVSIPAPMNATTTVTIDFSNIAGVDSVAFCQPVVLGAYRASVLLGSPVVNGNKVTLPIINTMQTGKSANIKFLCTLASSAQVARSVKIISQIL